MSHFGQLWSKTKTPILLLIFVFLSGAIGYRLFYPEESWHRIFLMTAITLSTVGYGDLLNVDQSRWASWYTILLILFGMGIVLYSVSFLASLLVDGVLREFLNQHTLDRRIQRMNDHFIICGAGQTGLHVVHEMHSRKERFVVIDNSREALQRLREVLPKCPLMLGDATRDLTLRQAGIDKARALIAVLPNDKDNIFLTLSARNINPKLKIIAKVVDEIIQPRMYSAGANYVLSPYRVSGIRIVSELLRPRAMAFFDQMLRTSDPVMRFEDVVIPQGSPISGRSLADSQIEERSGLTIIAYSIDGEQFFYNPPSQLVLAPGIVLVFIGEARQKDKLENLLRS